jgi:hypothetical protein
MSSWQLTDQSLQPKKIIQLQNYRQTLYAHFLKFETFDGRWSNALE